MSLDHWQASLPGTVALGWPPVKAQSERQLLWHSTNLKARLYRKKLKTITELKAALLWDEATRLHAHKVDVRHGAPAAACGGCKAGGLHGQVVVGHAGMHCAACM